ncbi:MAG: hypothetical protein P8L82_04470 [Paracoccaceae bacterium]|nr:hypothetical protein [Paracoccaceae bacterium]
MKKSQLCALLFYPAALKMALRGILEPHQPYSAQLYMALITLRHVKWLTNSSSVHWQALAINTSMGWSGAYRGLLTSIYLI